MVETISYGAWPSPITAEALTKGITATDVCIDAAQQKAYWCQIIPSEDGRGQIFMRGVGAKQAAIALLPAGYNCRSRVHEYGGGSFTVDSGLLIFSNNEDGRLYKLQGDNAIPEPITPDTDKKHRYADLVLDPDHRFLICIREEHFDNEEPKDVVNTLVAVCLETQQVSVIASGADFYASPRLSNHALAYVSWMHSNMPWDHTRLHHVSLDGDRKPRATEGADANIVVGNQESIVQPEFGLDGKLYFASDRSGFWNLYCYDDETKSSELLLEKPLEQEFVDAPWRLNESWYTPSKTDATKLICTNKDSLALLDTASRKLTNLKCKYSMFTQIRCYAHPHSQRDVIVANAASPTAPTVLIAYDAAQEAILEEIKPSDVDVSMLDKRYISTGREVTFPTTGDKKAYCYFYEPKNPNYTGEGKPPLRVLSHGGPTAMTDNGYSLSIQYWTTRGFAIADVNYGGSTGYGREYRNRLKKQWGVVDVDDCCNAALYLAEQGYVDRNKLAIEGGSAGGFIALACVAFRDVFNASCCKYGISDISLLAKETHKFESRYPDQLIGEYPKEKTIYEERSPIFKADQIKCPVIFFQGADDKVVPPSQSEIMVNTMKEKGVPVAYMLYPGEGHGFRRAENIQRTMKLTQWFYGQIFGFEVPGVEGIPIDNFPSKRQE